MKLQILATVYKQRVLLLSTAAILAPFSQVWAADALTTPTGEVVTSGSVTFDRPSEGLLDVNQNSHRAVINWDSFDIGHDATTQFNQPNTTSLAVNRVVGPGDDPTQILGVLRANGRVMVLDRNGVLFGRDSHIDVNGIIASTGNVADADVTDGGTIAITDISGGTIENRGTISAADAGLVGFVAPTVKNSGVINANFGRISMASGNQATVDLFGDKLIELAVDSNLEHALVENRGEILAEGGRVNISTEVAKDIVDNTINMSGIVDVSSVTQQGGKIILAGAENTNISGDLKANSMAGGGKITIDSNNINVRSNGNLETSTTFTGDGGSILLNAGHDINSRGKILANGEEAGGHVVIAAGNDANVNGQVQARGTGINLGGHINISSGHNTKLSGNLNANGIDGGGMIRVAAANDLTMTKQANISTRTLSTGQGGRVNLSGSNVITDGHINISGQEGGGRVVVNSQNDLDVNGTITGYSGIIGTGGRALLSGRGNTTANGRIHVNGTSGGGIITVDGRNVNLAEDSRLDARGLQSELPEVTSNKGGNISIFAFNDLNAKGSINSSGYDAGGGSVRLAANNVNLHGNITARSTHSGSGGTVLASGIESADLTGLVNTNGIDGGGLVRLASDTVSMSDTGVVQNSAITNGNGGHVLLKGTTYTSFEGHITSKGGSNSGNGGYVGFNKPNTVSNESNVDVTAENGTDGTFNH